MPADIPIPHSPEQLVQIVTTNITAKFPDHDRDDIRARVLAAYQRLAPDSRITDHLAVLVQHKAVESLRATTAS